MLNRAQRGLKKYVARLITVKNSTLYSTIRKYRNIPGRDGITWAAKRRRYVENASINSYDDRYTLITYFRRCGRQKLDTEYNATILYINEQY